MIFKIKTIIYKGLVNTVKFVGHLIPINPPIIFAGKDSSIQLSDAIVQMGHKSLLLVTDKMLVEIGLINNVLSNLENNSMKVVVYSGVLPDPTNSQVDEGVSLALSNHCDAVLAIGGGSSIDAAKAISACITNNKNAKQLSGLLKVKQRPLPLYVIPTTAGTGSEATLAALISDDTTHKKKLLIDPSLIPKMAALDGQLMLTLPPAITAASGMDALTHAIEAFISTNSTDETNALALSASKLILNNLETAVFAGDNFAARQSMAIASYYAGAAFTKAGVGYVHAIAHAIGAKYGTAHGIANAMILPHVLTYSYSHIEPLLAQIAKNAGLVTHEASINDAALRLIDKIKELNIAFDMPCHFDDLKPEHIKSIAKEALKEAHYTPYAVPMYMDQKTCEMLISNMQPST